MGYLIPVLLVLVVSSLLVPSAVSGAHLYTLCSKNYTKSSTADTYADNLHYLLDDLYTNGPESGFRKSSWGEGSNKVFGLSLCRGDASKHCRACIKEARQQINGSCLSSREGIVWYDTCYLKYSNSSFFGKIDSHNIVIMWNTNNASDPKGFYDTTMGLLDQVSQNASDANNGLMFASGCKKTKNETFYAMAQCSRDLSNDNCKQCLDIAVKKLPGITVEDGTVRSIPVGGRTLTGSCNVRYETYEFLNKQQKC